MLRLLIACGNYNFTLTARPGTRNGLFERCLQYLHNECSMIPLDEELTEINWDYCVTQLLGGCQHCFNYSMASAAIHGKRKSRRESSPPNASGKGSMVEIDGELGENDLDYWGTMVQCKGVPVFSIAEQREHVWTRSRGLRKATDTTFLTGARRRKTGGK